MDDGQQHDDTDEAPATKARHEIADRSAVSARRLADMADEVEHLKQQIDEARRSVETDPYLHDR
jgi:hypothetical protein